MLCTSLFIVQAASAEPLSRIAIVIDDLGHNSHQQRFVELPGKVTLALMPHTPFVTDIAHHATAGGKEVIIHMPMQPGGHQHEHDAGMIFAHADKDEVIQLMEQAFTQIPQAVGMNNHMGSELTSLAEPMEWVMEQLALRNLYFLDSRTTAATKAETVAKQYGLSVARRHIFLDNDPHPDAIAAAWNQLIQHAKKHGEAIAIAHPYSTTYEFLQQQLPELHKQGVELVFASQLVQPTAFAEVSSAQKKAPVLEPALSAESLD